MADRLGASDCWLMFSIWMGADGHVGAALTAFLIVALYCITPDPKPEAKEDLPHG